MRHVLFLVKNARFYTVVKVFYRYLNYDYRWQALVYKWGSDVLACCNPYFLVAFRRRREVLSEKKAMLQHETASVLCAHDDMRQGYHRAENYNSGHVDTNDEEGVIDRLRAQYS